MADTHRIPVGDGSSMYVEELGDRGKPTVVFGHSLLCDGRMFTDQVIALAHDHHVVNIDFRGHGRSGRPSRAYTMADQGRDYLRVMDALGIESAIVVGLSMGGMAAIHLALAAPSRVTGLVLMDTSASGETFTTQAKYAALAGSARLLGVREFHLAQALPLMFGATYRAAGAGELNLWRERMEALDKVALARAVWMVSRRPSMVHRLGEITAPTLVVVGDEDVATPLKYAKALASALPNARLEVLEATGHLSTIERPVETTRLIRDFCLSLI